MAVKLIKADAYYRVDGGRLQYRSVNGWHDMCSRCVKVVGKFKVFADHFDCAMPYTNYYVGDTETGEVAVYKYHPSYLGSLVGEIASQVEAHGIGDAQEPKKHHGISNALKGL